TSLSGGDASDVAISGCDSSGSGASARACAFAAGSGRVTLRGRAGARAGFTVGRISEDGATGGAVTATSVFTLATTTAGAGGAACTGLEADPVTGAGSGSTRAAVGSCGAAGPDSVNTGAAAAGGDSEVTTSAIGGRGRRGATLATSSA